MSRNTEWELLGSLISQFARAGAKPWELRMMALKGGALSMRDIARMALRHGHDVHGMRLEARDD